MLIDRRGLALSSLLLLLSSQAALAAEKAAFTVLPPVQVMHLGRLCSRHGPGRVTSGWDPAFSQIRQAEALLPGFVAKNQRPDRPLEEYYRQYLGVVIDG